MDSAILNSLALGVRVGVKSCNLYSSLVCFGTIAFHGDELSSLPRYDNTNADNIP